MDKIDYKSIWPQIKALIPVYDQYGGNSTRVLLIGGQEVMVNKKLNSVLKDILKVFALNVEYLKKNYGKLVGRKTSCPLPLHPKLILIPLKFRKPLVKDEGCRGYIRLDQIAYCTALSKTKTTLHFLDNTSIDCLQSAERVNLAVSHGQIIARVYISSLTIVSEEAEVYQLVRDIEEKFVTLKRLYGH